MNRIRPPGANERDVIAALAKLGEATCAELGQHCGLSDPSTNDALSRLRAAGKAHVSYWKRPNSKSVYSRVWVLGFGEDAPRPAKTPRIRRKLPFSEPVERTPDLPTSYAFKSVFAGNKNPWAASVTSE